MGDDTFMFGSDPQAQQREDAEKRGTSSFRGLLALIGELEYYSLIERLSRLPITERQLTTPTQLWALTKGAALGAIGTTWMLISHICVSLLAASFGWSLSLRIGLLAMLFAGTIYCMNDFLLKKIVFPDGAAAKLKKLMMVGYVGHVFIVKFTMCMIPWFLALMRIDIGRIIYQKAEWLYPFYLQIKMPPGVEWILFGAVVAGYVLATLRSNAVLGAMRLIQVGSRPYDLLTSGG